MSGADPSTARWPRGRLAIVVVVVLLVVALADVLVSAFGSHLRRPLYWPNFEIQHKIDQLDKAGHPYRTMFFGDSVVDSAVDPSLMRDLPGGAFNAALAGEPLPVVEDWATRILVPRFHPSTVVLGLNINVLSDPGNGQAGLVDYFHRSRPVAVAEGRGNVLDHLDGWLNAHFGLYKYRSVLRQPFGEAETAGTQIYNPPLTSLGWNEGFRAGVASSAAAALNQEAVTYQLDPHRLVVLSDFIRRLHAEGPNVVVVMMPVSSAYLDALPGGRATYSDAVGQMADRAGAGGASVLLTGQWSQRFFADSSHLNGAGTERFSVWLDHKLLADNISPAE